MGSKYQRYLAFAVMLYIVTFSTYSLLRHYSYLTTGYDLGIFMQSLWTTANGEGFFFNTGEWQDIGTYSHFGIHNSPILIFLVPLYKLFPYAETLLILQTLMLGIGAITLFEFAKMIIGERKAYYLSLMYLLNPLIHGINRFDFHPVSLVVPLIFLIPYYYEKRNMVSMTLTSFLVLTAKEDAGLVLISLAWFFIVKRYDLMNSLNPKFILKNLKELKWEIFLGLIGVAWIVVSLFIVIPHFNGGHYPYFDNSKLQRYSLTKIHVDYIVVFTFVALLGIAFIPLLNLKYLIPSLPLWMELFPSKVPEMLIIGYQYPYMLVPFLFITAVYTLKEINRIEISIETVRTKLKYNLTMREALVISLVTMILFSPAFHILQGPYIRGVPFYDLVRIHKKWGLYYSVLDNITEELSRSSCPVSTQNYIFPHLANRKNTYYLLTPFLSPYLDNNSIVLIAPSLPRSTYFIVREALKNKTLTKNKTYFILNINKVILSCYNQTGDNITEFRVCIYNYTKRIIQECKQARENAKSK